MGTPSSNLTVSLLPDSAPRGPHFGLECVCDEHPWGVLSVASQAQVAPKHSAARTAPYLMLAWIGLATALLVGVLLLVALRRSTLRPKTGAVKPSKATNTQSAWEESGKRLAMPPSAISEEPD